MGYSTDYVGHVEISPPLNAGERDYLSAFGATRHHDRGGSPYDLPGNPRAPELAAPGERYEMLAGGVPAFHCGWAICSDGDCMSYDGTEKFNDGERWLRYLIDTFLAPGAAASTANHPQLRTFTFEHRVDGVMAGCRRDNRELFLLRVVDNLVTREVLRRGDPEWFGETPYGYQQDRDSQGTSGRGRYADSPAAKARGEASVTVLRPSPRR